LAELKYQRLKHDHGAFLKKASNRGGFTKASQALEIEHAIIDEMLSARLRAGLTQEAIAARMGTTKNAISRLEAAGKHAPSLASLKGFAVVVGCRLRIQLVPTKARQGRSCPRARPGKCSELRVEVDRLGKLILYLEKSASRGWQIRSCHPRK